MEKTISLKFLAPDKWRYLRIIRCEGMGHDEYRYFVFYFRGYSFKDLDELDDAILKSLNDGQIAEFESNECIVFENQIRKITKKYPDKSYEINDLQINFEPFITDDLEEIIKLGKEVYSYNLKIQMIISKGLNFRYLIDSFFTNMDYKKLEELNGTIEPLLLNDLYN